MQNAVLISFATDPTRGGENGVGWSFLRGMAIYCRERGIRMHAVIDQRDEESVRSLLGQNALSEAVVLRPVSQPTWIASRYGNSKSRLTYLLWLRGARRIVRGVVRECDGPTVAHQVTFASATLPSALPLHTRAKTIWGPLMVPLQASPSTAARIRSRDRLGARFGTMLARRFLQRPDTVIANNESTFEWLGEIGKQPLLEPNIFVEPSSESGRTRSGVVMVGHLIPRKRPWLAIEAMAQPEADSLELRIIGDGVLRAALERLTRELGVQERVHFLGAVDRDQVLSEMGSARVLAHPSAREGSPWVVGEAAAVGTPAVVVAGSGADTVVRMSDVGGCIVPSADARMLSSGIRRIYDSATPEPSQRWSPERLPSLLDEWWR